MLDFLTALALVLVIEGALYALFPETMKRAMTFALAQPVEALRTGGAVAVAIGVVVVWLIRTLGA